jgi:hypothetical protein
MLMRWSILYPWIKGIEDSFYCKVVPKSMAKGCDPPGHLQTLGVVFADVALPPFIVCALVGGDFKFV